MTKKEQFKKLMLEILASENNQEKHSKGKELFNLFKDAELDKNTTEMSRINNLKRITDNIKAFIENDNELTRNNLKTLGTFIPEHIKE